MDQELDDRKKKILKAIIKTYMETGEPVGSRTISKFADLNVSSATIRNEMSDLTDMGYIVQPHTSAGRIPSDKGYRLYVDELMREKESEVQEIKDWEKVVNSLVSDFDVDLYVTGSNSRMMSSEISTYLTGRYIAFRIFTLSFSEYLMFKEKYEPIW